MKLLESLFGGNLKSNEELNLNMFDSTNEEKTYVQETEALLKNVLLIDASKDKKSISTAMSEMKESISSMKKEKKGKGADMLELLDEAAERSEKEKSRSRSQSRGNSTQKQRSSCAGRPSSVKKVTKPKPN
ncbi:hypothetical protein DICVIV_06588 [Dictyocaulus viviparus]|uniref:Uncharacterized protein n=1 Tax=Dictyocaulus viviparus TaxID=29172 RepID=A0A0D8XUA9_DICVI|nr:hypothetical protein DICVIV_06588 [Dictyocaulus viviparus]